MRPGYSASQPAGVEPAGAARPAPHIRVFVGMKIAPAIADQLGRFAEILERPFARPGARRHSPYAGAAVDEASIPEAVAKLRRVVAGFGAFSLLFQHVGYGPQPRRPRLLWVECAAGDEISALRRALLQTFGQTDERPFLPHVTLARIRAEAPAIARKYPIDQPLSLTQRVESVELFQSPPPGESGYRVLASLRLAETPGPEPTMWPHAVAEPPTRACRPCRKSKS